MGTAANVAEATIGRLRPAAGLTLLGEDPSSGIPGSRFLLRRADRQVIQLFPLPYLVAVAIAEVAAAGNNGRVGTDGADPVLVAARVSRDSGQHLTAADVRSLVTGQLGPLGVLTAGTPGRAPGSASDGASDGAPGGAPDVPADTAPKKAHRPRRRTVVLGAAAALAAVAGATLAVVAITRPGRPPAKATASEVQVAAWVARQVNRGTVVSCDPVICAVDPRLMATLSVLSGQQPIELVAFDPAAPGASPAVPVRGVQLGAASASGRSAILAFLGAQRGTYRPGRGRRRPPR
jgi:hypothetical protein